MIPHIIHYTWLGGNPLPELAERCITSWEKYMPEWKIMRWDESNFDIAAAPLYVRQAYEARKFAFVSDYVRLWALEQYGGLYMDVDFEVYRPFDELMDKYAAFAGYEGSKRMPVMQGIIASEAHGAWVRDMLETYKVREFILPDGRLDLTPNTTYFTDRLESQGFIADGIEKNFYLIDNQKNLKKNAESSVTDSDSTVLTPQSTHKQAFGLLDDSLRATDTDTQSLSNDSAQKISKNTENICVDEGIFMLHVYPVHYFCPQLTTGENVRNEETYCEHKGLHSWGGNGGWKAKILSRFSPDFRTKLIKLKRKVLG